MHRVKLERVDLNLLPILDAILFHESTAAERRSPQERRDGKAQDPPREWTAKWFMVGSAP